jgi:hypothetical protein
MVRTEEQLWEKSFQTSPRLSPAEAHRLVVLRQRLTELRYLSLEYLLRRANFSASKGERVAWQSVWALVVFVEHHKRFPRQGELYPYLHNVLDESKTLEELKLPTIDSSFAGLDSGLEAQKSLSEQLRSDVTSLRASHERVLREVSAFEQELSKQSQDDLTYNAKSLWDWLQTLRSKLKT